ncbi:hypothetical protein ON010_g6939 [Phytophthora cinnamomi]|nr:hypothetical protein ON010_g6939 [Phytophthora cinnamomi]
MGLPASLAASHSHRKLHASGHGRAIRRRYLSKRPARGRSRNSRFDRQVSIDAGLWYADPSAAVGVGRVHADVRNVRRYEQGVASRGLHGLPRARPGKTVTAGTGSVQWLFAPPISAQLYFSTDGRHVKPSADGLQCSIAPFARTSASMLSRVPAGDHLPDKLGGQDVKSPVAVVAHANALGRRHSLCGLASVSTAGVSSTTRTAVAGYAGFDVNGSASDPRLRELPVLRARYVAREVRVLSGSRWRLHRFQERTIVLRTGEKPTLAMYAADGGATAFDVDCPEVQPETTYVLALDTTCELTGSSGIQLRSAAKNSAAFRLRIRFPTTADASIWCSIVREALAHARWSRDVRPVQQEHAPRGKKIRVVQHVRSSKCFVVKTLAPSGQQGDCHELHILRRLYTSSLAQDVDLVRGYRVVETPEEMVLVMPQLPGTTLLQFLRQRRRRDGGRKLSEEEAWRLLEKLVTLLQVVHRSGVVHCDLNLENVLVTSDISQAWIIDFGGAYSLLDGSTASGQAMTGTPGYVAPERVQDPLPPPTPQADVFSLGILLFQALTGQHPYLDASKRPLQLSDSLSLDWPRAEALLTAQVVPFELKELVRKMLVVDPHARISLDKLLETHKRQ